jgi:hypothetical protein
LDRGQHRPRKPQGQGLPRLGSGVLATKTALAHWLLTLVSNRPRYTPSNNNQSNQ